MEERPLQLDYLFLEPDRPCFFKDRFRYVRCIALFMHVIQTASAHGHGCVIKKDGVFAVPVQLALRNCEIGKTSNYL